MDDRTPPGERDVFNMVAAGPEDWVAMHSLDLAPWNRGLRTEIDFVVIVPDTGLLCIEVKSHETISFENDRYRNGTTLPRDPAAKVFRASGAWMRGKSERNAAFGLEAIHSGGHGAQQPISLLVRLAPARMQGYQSSSRDSTRRKV